MTGLRLADLAELIDGVAPFELAEPWDNVGLQIGAPERAVRHAMFALEVTPAVIREAVRRRADTIVTHHPLIFKPLKHVDENVAVHRLVAEMIRRGLALIVAHTNLDASPEGTNAVLARLLGMEPERPLFPASLRCKREGDQGGWGLGARARLKEPMALALLARQLRRALKCDAVQLVGDGARPVRRVAICTGAGSEIVRNLPPRTFDVLITGEINHHGAMDAATVGLAVLCAGHFETEAPAMSRLAELIAAAPTAQKAKLKVSISQSESSPIKVVR